jgi:hypothetical protein
MSAGKIDRAVLDLMLDGPSAYRIVSNYTELEIVATLAAAKRRAVDESNRFDDLVVIEAGGRDLYLARHGRLYRLAATR